MYYKARHFFEILSSLLIEERKKGFEINCKPHAERSRKTEKKCPKAFNLLAKKKKSNQYV